MTSAGAQGAMRAEPPLSRDGAVAEFDERRGIGLIVGVDGARHGFHCTAILDGSRTISVGEAVRFQVRTGPLGREEAAGISRA